MRLDNKSPDYWRGSGRGRNWNQGKDTSRGRISLNKRESHREKNLSHHFQCWVECSGMTLSESGIRGKN